MNKMQPKFLLGLILLQGFGQNYSKTYLVKTKDDKRPIASNYMCKRDLSDRLPANLIKVLENPKAYIAGPLGKEVVPKEEALIIGAGMAGLTAAYLLLSVGHKVTLLEGQDRIGGRVYTHYGKGWYGDLGAMRFKQCHKIVMKALELFDVPLAPFTSKDQGSQGNFYHLNGKTIPLETMFSPEGLPYIYKTFGIPDNKVPRYGNGTIMNPRKIIGSYLKRELTDRDHCKQDESLSSFIRRKLAADKYDERIADIFATLTAMQSFMTYSVDYFLTDADSADLDDCHDKTIVEIVNGSSVLPENMMRRLEAFPTFKLITAAKVTKVEDKNNRVQIHYKHGHTEKTLSGDWVLVTATAGAVDLIKFEPSLPFWKSLALKNLKYINAGKVFMKFKTPFWSKSENNLAPPIKYGPYRATKNLSRAGQVDQLEDKKMGATGSTDSHLKQIYYPSFDFHGPSLLASYAWDSDADFFLSLKDEDVQELVLSELEEIHGPVVREEFESMVVKRWQTDEFSHGAFVFHEPFQKYTYMNHLREPVGNIHFAGEYTNKQYNGWVESAMESSLRTLVNRAPQSYDEEFKEEELKKLREEGYKQ